MISIYNVACYFKALPNQVKALKMLDDLLKDSPLVQDDQPWVKMWRLPKYQSINQAGLDLIKEFEGLVLTAYDDGVGVWTIGYGHTKNVLPNDTITFDHAIALLEQDLQEFEKGVSELVQVPLTDNQFSALVCFTFNVGLGAFENSTMLGFLNAGNFAAAAGQFKLWVYGGGKVLDGLKARRAAEKALFLT
jgi:lysozyme